MNVKQQYKYACSLLRERNELAIGYSSTDPETVEDIEAISDELESLPQHIVQAAADTTWPAGPRGSAFAKKRADILWDRACEEVTHDDELLGSSLLARLRKGAGNPNWKSDD